MLPINKFKKKKLTYSMLRGLLQIAYSLGFIWGIEFPTGLPVCVPNQAKLLQAFPQGTFNSIEATSILKSSIALEKLILWAKMLFRYLRSMTSPADSSHNMTLTVSFSQFKHQKNPQNSQQPNKVREFQGYRLSKGCIWTRNWISLSIWNWRNWRVLCPISWIMNSDSRFDIRIQQKTTKILWNQSMVFLAHHNEFEPLGESYMEAKQKHFPPESSKYSVWTWPWLCHTEIRNPITQVQEQAHD